MLRLHEEGYSVALHVHDEVVIEVPKRNAEFHSHNINRIMSMTPTWAPGLPIGTEAKIAKTYAEGK
jgi:DNA polymerase